MSFSDTLSAILSEPTTVKFVPGTDRADFGAIDLAKNPQKTSQGFSWFLPNRVTEATVTFVGRVVYDVIGDKTDEYFSLPGEQWLPVVTAEEMAKAKVGFAIRLFNRDLPEDGSLPEELFEHNQALLEFFMTVQEEADERLGSGGSNGEGEEAVKHVVSIKPFVKHPPNHPFFVVPVIGTVLFPHFKGSKSPGVLRTKGRKGRVSLNPHSTPAPSSGDGDPVNPRVFFGGLPDPLGRYRVLKMNESYSRYEMCVPPVFDAQGHPVLPASYRTTIPDGTIVAVRGSMKMYNICARGSFLNRPYLFVFDRLQVVGEEMTSWGPGFKKRPGGSAESDGSKRFCSDPGPSDPKLPYDEDL